MMKMNEYYDKKTLNSTIDQLIAECKLARLHPDSILALSRFKLILNTFEPDRVMVEKKEIT